MSIRAVAWVLHDSPATGNDRLILIAIADEAADDGTGAYPGVDLIAHKARVNRATVLRGIARLEARGELLALRPERRGRGRHNTYAVVMGRNPLDLAARLGWPPPALDPGTLDALEWSQTATIPDAGKVAQWSHQAPEKVAPGATRPVSNPRTRGSRRVVEDPTAGTQAAARALEERNAARAAELAGEQRARPAAAAGALAAARAALAGAPLPPIAELDLGLDTEEARPA